MSDETTEDFGDASTLPLLIGSVLSRVAAGDVDVDEVVATLQMADRLYFYGESPVDDADYDTLKRCVYAADPTHPYLKKVGAPVETLDRYVDLPCTMGSLNQLQESSDVARWVAANSLHTEDAVITDKLDGTAMLVKIKDSNVVEAYSRGDGERGQDWTIHAKHLTFPDNVEDGLYRVEVIISKSNWDKLKNIAVKKDGTPYKNARNCVSGLMNTLTQHTTQIYAHISVVAYEIVGSSLSKLEQLEKLERHGFNVALYTVIPFAQLSGDIHAFVKQRKQDSLYELDGVVVDINTPSIRKALGYTDLNPNFAFKYKVADESNDAIVPVVEVEWLVSKDAYLIPRVVIEPVELMGVTVQRAAGFNAKFIRDAKIGPGAKIRITRSGDVIPYIKEVIAPAPGGAQLPDVEYEWTETDVSIILTDKSHPIVRVEMMKHFAESVDIPGLGGGNIQKLIDGGFPTLESVIIATPLQISTAVGSAAIGQKIWTGIHTKMHGIEKHTLLGAHPAFGRGVGSRKMKKLMSAFNGDLTKLQDAAAIVAVEGFEQKTASKIIAGYAEFEHFLNCIEGHYSFAAPKVTQQHLASYNVVITGFRDPELVTFIEAGGGKVSDSVSKKTTHVVAANPAETSGKLKKARDLGVPVMSRTDFKAILGL